MLFVHGQVSCLNLGHCVIHLHGSGGEVLLSCQSIICGLCANLCDLGLEQAVQSSNLIVSSTLVLVEDGTKLATSLGGLGMLGIHEFLNAIDLSRDVHVHSVLHRLVGDDLPGNLLGVDGHLTVHCLDLGSDSQQTCREVLASYLHLLSSLTACSFNVLHSLDKA